MSRIEVQVINGVKPGFVFFLLRASFDVEHWKEIHSPPPKNTAPLSRSTAGSNGIRLLVTHDVDHDDDDGETSSSSSSLEADVEVDAENFE